MLPDRLRRLARASGFVADIVQIAPDTQTALALVGAQVGCHLTLASVARNVDDPHVVFIPLDEGHQMPRTCICAQPGDARTRAPRCAPSYTSY